jgi:hypothetical protein
MLHPYSTTISTVALVDLINMLRRRSSSIWIPPQTAVDSRGFLALPRELVILINILLGKSRSQAQRFLACTSRLYHSYRSWSDQYLWNITRDQREAARLTKLQARAIRLEEERKMLEAEMMEMNLVGH